jgi:hypothetical protein
LGLVLRLELGIGLGIELFFLARSRASHGQGLVRVSG